jgi:hypothetical protein
LRPYAIADGHSIGSFYGFVTDGIWNSREEVINSKQFQTQYPDYTVNGSDAATEEIIVDIKGVDKKYTCNAVEGAENIDAQQCYQRAKELCDMVIARRGVDFDLVFSS